MIIFFANANRVLNNLFHTPLLPDLCTKNYLSISFQNVFVILESLKYGFKTMLFVLCHTNTHHNI